jgi:hypothetical protein
MDPTPERFVLQPPNLPAGTTCQSIAMNPQSGVVGASLPNNFPCSPDNVAFRNMISELGFAVAPTAFHPARTTGIGGFALTLEANYTHINADSFSTATDGTKTQYWHAGTQGSTDPNTKAFGTTNSSPDSMLQIYAMKARKGLPFGFEVTGSLGFIANTTMWVGGADVRWSLLEGFRTGPLGRRRRSHRYRHQQIQSHDGRHRRTGFETDPHRRLGDHHSCRRLSAPHHFGRLEHHRPHAERRPASAMRIRGPRSVDRRTHVSKSFVERRRQQQRLQQQRHLRQSSRAAKSRDFRRELQVRDDLLGHANRVRSHVAARLGSDPHRCSPMDALVRRRRLFLIA